MVCVVYPTASLIYNQLGNLHEINQIGSIPWGPVACCQLCVSYAIAAYVNL